MTVDRTCCTSVLRSIDCVIPPKYYQNCIYFTITVLFTMSVELISTGNYLACIFIWVCCLLTDSVMYDIAMQRQKIIKSAFA